MKLLIIVQLITINLKKSHYDMHRLHDKAIFDVLYYFIYQETI